MSNIRSWKVRIYHKVVDSGMFDVVVPTIVRR